MVREIFFSCGDSSGDIHASKLAGAFKNNLPGLKISGAGGANLKLFCDNFLFDLVRMDLHGYWEPMKQYWKIREMLDGTIVEYLRENRPDAVIAVDFYGFNIALCEAAHSLGLKVFYYISPQVWATRPGRINRIKKCVDKMYLIFPFEEKIYRDSGVNAAFVGHPMLDTIPQRPAKKFNADNPSIGLFPGSRRQVIGWNLPFMLQSAQLIKGKIPGARILIAGMEDLRNYYTGINGAEVVFDRGYGWREKLDLAISASGTVSLENALLGIPMVVCYKLPWLMYFLVKSMVNVSYATMVNLINGRESVQEFIQGNAKPERIASAVMRIISDAGARESILKEYGKMRGLLGSPGSYERTAGLMLGEISNAGKN